MQLIQTVTVGSGGAASIEFTSIPTDGTYTDLYLVLSSRGTYSGGGAANIYLKFNATSSGYAYIWLQGNGASATVPVNVSGQSQIWVSNIANDTWTANTFGSTSIYIPNYTSSAAKSVSIDNVNENNATTAYQHVNAGLWTGTAAISSIALTLELGDFKQYSSASLYGITKGSDGIVTVS